MSILFAPLENTSPTGVASVRNLLNAVEERLNLLRQTRCAELAKAIDKNHATISRDRDKLNQWRADELLVIARSDPPLRNAIIEALSPEVDRPHNLNVFRAVVEELGQMAALSKSISDSIADLAVDRDEARVILQDLYVMDEFMRQTLIPALEHMQRPPSHA
jgi:hypothetical protein